MLLFSNVALTPAYELVCRPDHTQTIVNGQPEQEVSKKDAQFSLQMDANDEPVAVLPTNLSADSDQIVHQINEKPIRSGEQITYRIGYMQPLFPSNGDPSLEGLSKLAHIAVSGDLEVNTKTLTFKLQQTFRMNLNLNMPITKQEDLHIVFKGDCIKQSLHSQRFRQRNTTLAELTNHQNH